MGTRLQISLLICLIITGASFFALRQKALRTRSIQHWAEVYHSDPKEAAQNYRNLVGSDGLRALQAEDQLERQKQYEMAALALPDVKDDGAKGNLIRFVLAEKAHFSPTAFAAAITELERENKRRILDDDGEKAAGLDNTKAALATAIARWVNLPDPKLSAIPIPTRAEYDAFMAEARRKAATMTENSPD